MLSIINAVNDSIIGGKGLLLTGKAETSVKQSASY